MITLDILVGPPCAFSRVGPEGFASLWNLGRPGGDPLRARQCWIYVPDKPEAWCGHCVELIEAIVAFQ